MLTLLLASENPAKLERLRWLVDGLALHLFTPADLSRPPEGDEIEETHLEVARGKALRWSTAAGGLALATDGGLHVPCLGPRWESRLTRRASRHGATNPERAGRLLDLMRGLEGDQRTARWLEAAALADRGTLVASWEVTSTEPMRVTGSYDPTGVPDGFWVPGLLEFPRLGLRYSHMSPDQRERALDHWSRLRPLIRQAVGQYV